MLQFGIMWLLIIIKRKCIILLIYAMLPLLVTLSPIYWSTGLGIFPGKTCQVKSQSNYMFWFKIF